MKKAIVTGANGFIGKALCAELVKHDVEVTAVVRDISKDTLHVTEQIKIVCCDMKHILQLPSLIREREFDAFFQLAWGGISGNQRADYNIQLESTLWMLSAVDVAMELGCRRFVGAGTLAELDVAAYSPLDGSVPNSVSMYGAAKIAAHYMSKAQCSKNGIEHLWAYISNLYGEGDKSLNFINFAIENIWRGTPDFTLGEQYYDFLHVKDAAYGLYCIADSGKSNHSYYIGSEHPRKLKNYIISIRDIINPQMKLNFGAVPYHGVITPKETFDCTKIIEDTGYHAKISFDEGIKSRICEFMENS